MGSNVYGQLGLGDSENRGEFTFIRSGIREVVAREYVTYFIDNQDILWKCGMLAINLGRNETIDLSPVQVATNVRSVATSGYHTLYVTNDDVLWGYGYASHNRLGLNQSNGVTPIQIATGVAEAAAGSQVSLYVLTNGLLYGLGSNLGLVVNTTNNNVNYGTPQLIDSGVTSVSADGSTHAVYLKSNGALWGVGYSNFGELGQGSGSFTVSKRKIVNASNVVSAVAGPGITLYIDSNGDLYGMGKNSSRQLSASSANILSPVLIANHVSASTTDGNAVYYRTRFAQTISLPDISTATFGDGPVLLPSRSSEGLPIEYGVTGPAFVAENKLIFTGKGNVHVQASQSGDATRSPASSGISITVGGVSAKFTPRAAFADAPCFVNSIFQLTDLSGRGLNFAPELFEFDNTVFEVREDSGPLSPTESFLQVAKFAEVPAKIRTVLLLDNSASVGLSILKIRDAAKQLVASLLPQQEVALYSFSGDVILLQDFTADVDLLKAAIDRLTLGSATTDLYGAIYDTLDRWTESYSLNGIETGFLVLLTDGSDTTGRRTRQEVLAKRDNEGKRIFAIGLGAEADTASLSMLGNASYQPVSAIDQLSETFSAIQGQIEDAANSFYWVNYASPKRGNAVRSLQISLRGNLNGGAGSSLTQTFNSNGFSDVSRAVTINRSVYNTEGVTDRLTVTSETSTLRATTILPLDFAGRAYSWTIANPGLVFAETSGENDGKLTLRSRGTAGTTTLTLRDEGNIALASQLSIPASVYTRTITLEVLAGSPSDAWFPSATRHPSGWMLSDWFGWWLDDRAPWLYHTEHGWIFAGRGDEDSGLFLYDQSLGCWTYLRRSLGTWRYAYAPYNVWLYYQPGGIPGKRWFLRGSDRQWLLEPQLKESI